MKRTLALAIAILLTNIAPSLAEPTRVQLDKRASQLEKKLAGQGYTVLVEPPFVVVGDSPAKEVKRITTGFLRRKTALLEKELFAKRPDKVLEVWLFRNRKTFLAGAKKFFGDEPDTPFGYYSPDAGALIMNASGLGTLSHELVHPYMEANFPDVPAWFNEGLASLYEQPSERGGRIVGLPNWRLPNLKKEIRAKTLPKLATLLATTSDEFYDADYDSYAYARYLVYYLQEHGKLQTFYKQFRDDKKDLTGAAALTSVLGEDLASFEPKWRTWVLAIPYRR
ncbi:MAG TPA: DUF1570 domain-containing protein [Kofleriaceae bacterium]|nr:DUF1570 domain-containing protein [Kofleriaceae bacterium]